MTADEMNSLTYIFSGDKITTMDSMFQKVFLILISLMIFISIVGVFDIFIENSFFLLFSSIIFLTIFGFFFLKAYKFLDKNEIEEKDNLVDKFYKEYKIKDRKDFQEDFIDTNKFYQIYHLFYFGQKGQELAKYVFHNYKKYNKVDHNYAEYGPRSGGTEILNMKIEYEVERMKKEEAIIK